MCQLRKSMEQIGENCKVKQLDIKEFNKELDEAINKLKNEDKNKGDE